MDSDFTSPTPSNSSGSSLDVSWGNTPITNIQYGRLIGTGGFGSVYLAKLDNVGLPVAVKRLHSHMKNVAAKTESFKAESRLLNFSHPNIVCVLATAAGTPVEDPLIVMEYAGTHNLQQLINKAERPFDVLVRMSYALDISQALAYLHRNCLIHLDVKPANVIVNETTNRCKLADFGCSQETMKKTGSANQNIRSHLTGTYVYRAPELLRGQPASTKADIYALGITMWQMLSLEVPYSGLPQQPVIFAVVRSHLRPTLSVKLQKDCTDIPVEKCYIELYKQCWHHDVRVRPSADDLVEVLSFWKRDIITYKTYDSIFDPEQPKNYENGSYRRHSSLEVQNFV
ncbi:hypothetical protein LSH36_548g02038 [Paralvinella palmiformis]|uniref:non-specific serine/threonine protein kinase n=1 Tax=Paralvinella palmiformis TaxID=53620 RepID=A0AAD9J7P0_9ANNE|nr:hypothetical protein LSH36_548g02038 [Paralvinella palmiformis]